MLPPDRNGFPQFPPGKSGSATRVVNGLSHMTTRGMPLSTLISQLGSQLGTNTGPITFAFGRIVDKTKRCLTGNYDFPHWNTQVVVGLAIGGAIPTHLTRCLRTERRSYDYRRDRQKTARVEWGIDERHGPVRRPGH